MREKYNPEEPGESLERANNVTEWELAGIAQREFRRIEEVRRAKDMVRAAFNGETRIPEHLGELISKVNDYREQPMPEHL